MFIVVDQKERTVEFKELAKDLPKYDISRYFLAMLHLAAEGQVRLQSDGHQSLIVEPANR